MAGPPRGRGALALLVASCAVPPHCRVCDALGLGRSDAIRTTAPPRIEPHELDPEKLQWLHIPRSGSAMANILITWACPGIPDRHEFKFGTNYDAWNRQFATKFCKWGFRLHGDTGPISSRWHKKRHSRGNMVTFLRQPEQRMISAFNDARQLDPSYDDLELYAWDRKGCVVRMLNGRPCEPGRVSKKDAYSGIQTLMEEFAFVGLTHEWDLSVCLFHKMFGGKCHRREFRKLHPSRETSTWYKTVVPDSAKDELDGSVYDEATVIFWRNMKEFGVHRAACLDICKDFPDPFRATNDTKLFMANESSSMGHDSIGYLAYIEH